MGNYKPELKAECLRLRTVEHKSFREIAALTGASKGSLSGWLHEYPLPEGVLVARKQTWIRHRPPRKDRGSESEIHRAVRAYNLNGVQVAKVSEAAILLRLLVQGFNVFGSVFDGDKTDWLVEVPETGKVHKIQVKTAVNLSQGLPAITLCHGINSKAGRRRYGPEDFDFIAGYDLFTDTAYVWSKDEVKHLKAAVSICPAAREKWEKLRV